MPEPPAPADLGPTEARLDAIEARLAALLARPATPAVQTVVVPAPVAAPPTPVRAGSRNLLTHAAYGTPDDLKVIKGVAGVLERMLHGIGVYYFWQIAEWTPSDIAFVDTQLTAFRGRIDRDGWVDQCRHLALEPGAARRPHTEIDALPA